MQQKMGGSHLEMSTGRYFNFGTSCIFNFCHKKIAFNNVIYLTSAESGTFLHGTADAVKRRERRFSHMLGKTFFLRVSIFIKSNENVL